MKTERIIRRIIDDEIDDKLIRTITKKVNKVPSDYVSAYICISGILKEKSIPEAIAFVLYRLGKDWKWMITNAVDTNQWSDKFMHMGMVHYPTNDPGPGPRWAGIHEEPACALFIATLNAIDSGF